MLLIDQRLRHLQRLHLGHRLRVSLSLALLGPLLLAGLPHRCYLRLQQRAVAAHLGLVGAEGVACRHHDFLA